MDERLTPAPALALPLPRPKILVVDDTPANLVAMRRLLSRVDAELVMASSGNDALAACIDHEFALILLDVQMPDIDGFEVAGLLSGEARTADTPIIFVTAAFSDDVNRLRGYHFGAVDYIAKPINDVILQSKVRVFLDLYRGRQELQKLVAELDGRNRQLEVEIAERKRAEQEVRHRATHDTLTELPNRALFMDRVDQGLQRADRQRSHVGLLYLDIDGFKPVNDKLGHHAGDVLLQQIAQRLRGAIRKSDTVARLGGDEFAVVMEDAVEGPHAAVQLGEKLLEVLAAPYALDLGLDAPVTVNIGSSIGVALFPDHCRGARDRREALIRAADAAMYSAKQSGKNRVVLAP
jgi:diguanylate cyclase (GGDEF)-like protein